LEWEIRLSWGVKVQGQPPNTVKRDMIGRCRGTSQKFPGNESGDNAKNAKQDLTT